MLAHTLKHPRSYAARRTLTVVICAILTLFSSQGIADRVEDIYSETGERAKQGNEISAEHKGKWLPVPIPMSNPTVGTGLQAALLYLHAKKGDDPDAPNATSGIGGMYTDSDSKALGIFHDNSFSGDRFRLRAMAGSGDLNLKFFGVGDTLVDYSIDFNMEVDTTMLQFSTRLPGTKDWFLGLRYLWIDADVDFERSNLFPVLPDVHTNIVSSNLGLLLTYDSRNDNYYPTKGGYLELIASKDSPNWGSDYDFKRNTVKYVQYFSITEKQTLALKGAVSDVGEDAPFFLMSTLKMRGFAAGRYLDNSSAELHAEWRYKFLPRWGVVTFAEAGKIADSLSTLSGNSTVKCYGAGLRWQAIESKQMHLGIDFAFSDDDDAVYLRVGEAF